MSELSTLARPYAQAVFKTAVESKSVSEWSDMLGFLSVVMQDKELIAVIANPKVSQEQRTILLLNICQDQLSGEGSNLLKLLLENDRLLLTPQISELYESYKADHEGYIDVEVISAYTLTKEEQKKFATTLKKKLNKKVHITTSIDKSLIGGFLAKAGDKVIDGSTKGQLQQLAKKL
ncbi:MAG: F0F1 ATP synthase subunit delta [Methylococcales symbiont of Hymedesmia sp. n. MRB-2018]|nr:MAG: F0F1 ATP synthase subunit delta [Methylococcales symbiont of Hymedesmia sp. n. MRB-2018]KAF3984035.1 MAG: F0F1 ATP synthase subunit delta [Methylococcales symbiont of Hymedesmia sp. n. MRB-2018]